MTEFKNVEMDGLSARINRVESPRGIDLNLVIGNGRATNFGLILAKDEAVELAMSIIEVASGSYWRQFQNFRAAHGGFEEETPLAPSWGNKAHCSFHKAREMKCDCGKDLELRYPECCGDYAYYELLCNGMSGCGKVYVVSATRAEIEESSTTVLAWEEEHPPRPR